MISDIVTISGEESQKPKVENVGEEFIKWAEKYWLFDSLITKGINSMNENSGESCNYPTIREIFINKINELNSNSLL